jgi:hypothetical protein
MNNGFTFVILNNFFFSFWAKLCVIDSYFLFEKIPLDTEKMFYRNVNELFK